MPLVLIGMVSLAVAKLTPRFTMDSISIDAVILLLGPGVSPSAVTDAGTFIVPTMSPRKLNAIEALEPEPMVPKLQE